MDISAKLRRTSESTSVQLRASGSGHHLAKHRLGTEASIWRIPALEELDARGAILQNRWSPVHYAKPTGLPTHAGVLVDTPGLRVGWPAFDDHDWYKGPLPEPGPQCVPLFGKVSTATSRLRQLRRFILRCR